MKVTTYLLAVLTTGATHLCFAQEKIRFEALVDGSSRMVDAFYTKPKLSLGLKSPAVVIMHSTGGRSRRHNPAACKSVE